VFLNVTLCWDTLQWLSCHFQRLSVGMPKGIRLAPFYTVLCSFRVNVVYFLHSKPHLWSMGTAILMQTKFQVLHPIHCPSHTTYFSLRLLFLVFIWAQTIDSRTLSSDTFSLSSLLMIKNLSLALSLRTLTLLTFSICATSEQHFGVYQRVLLQPTKNLYPKLFSILCTIPRKVITLFFYMIWRPIWTGVPDKVLADQMKYAALFNLKKIRIPSALRFEVL
jgi:hypothetical protein